MSEDNAWSAPLTDPVRTTPEPVGPLTPVQFEMEYDGLQLRRIQGVAGTLKTICVVLVIAIVSAFAMRSQTVPLPSAIAPAIVPLVFMALGLLLYFQLYKKSATLHDFHRHYTVSFSDEHIEQIGRDGTSWYRWQYVRGYTETSEGLFVALDGERTLFLTARALANPTVDGSVRRWLDQRSEKGLLTAENNPVEAGKKTQSKWRRTLFWLLLVAIFTAVFRFVGQR